MFNYVYTYIRKNYRVSKSVCQKVTEIVLNKLYPHFKGLPISPLKQRIVEDENNINLLRLIWSDESHTRSWQTMTGRGLTFSWYSDSCDEIKSTVKKVSVWKSSFLDHIRVNVRLYSKKGPTSRHCLSSSYRRTHRKWKQ